MQYTILLDRDTNTSIAETEEKFKFIRVVIELLNIDLSFWDADQEITTDLRIQIRSVAKQYDVQIIEKTDKSVEIYFEHNIIAKWEPPTYKLKRDESQVDKRKQLFLEMQVSFSSIFEDS